MALKGIEGSIISSKKTDKDGISIFLKNKITTNMR